MSLNECFDIITIGKVELREWALEEIAAMLRVVLVRRNCETQKLQTTEETIINDILTVDILAEDTTRITPSRHLPAQKKLIP